MAVALVQSKLATAGSSASSVTATFDSTPTSGNLMVAMLAVRSHFGDLPTSVPSGWTYIGQGDTGHVSAGGEVFLYYKMAGASEPTAVTFQITDGKRLQIAEFSGVVALDTSTSVTVQPKATALSIGPLTPTAGVAALLVGVFAAAINDYLTGTYSPGSGYTELYDSGPSGPQVEFIYKAVATTSGSYTASTTINYSRQWGGVFAIFAGTAPPPPPVPDPGVILDPTGSDPINVSEDVVSWRISRGASAEITGSATPGQATVLVKNTDDRYNPENGSSDIIDLLRDGTGIWIGVNNDGLLTGSDRRGLFGGRITDITVLPSPGATTAPFVEFTCEDALGWYSRTPVRLDYSVLRSQRDLRREVLLEAGESAGRMDLAHEIQTIPLAGADGDALGIVEAINKANGTRHFVAPADDPADWYAYTTRNRQWHLDGSADASLSQLSDHVTQSGGWRLSADTVTNQQKATVTPIDFSASTFTVWTADKLPVSVTTTRPYTVWIQFDDYVQTPVVDSVHSGSTPTITLTPFGDTAKLNITVASGTCTFTRLSIEGSIARRLPTESWIADDLTSQALPRGVRAGAEISGEYVGVMAAARGIAEHVVWRYGNPQLRPTLTVENWFPEQFDLDLYDIISFSSPQLGVTSRLFEIVGLTHEGHHAATDVIHHTVTYVLQECRVQSDPGWFVLDTSELDSTDVLGY